MLLNGKNQANVWRELETLEQRLSRGGNGASRPYDSMGRPTAQTFTNFGNQMVAGITRVDRVRQALDQSVPMAKRLVGQQLSGIGISAVWDILIATCKEIALYYGGAVVAGAAVGGAIGSAAFGVGAVPGVMIGGAAGAQVGTWVMALIGLKELVEGLGSMLPAALDHYERGFREAWGATPSERSDTWKSSAPASGNMHTGAWYMAQGHVIMVMAILTALVAYLTRGRGSKAALMQEIRTSPRFGPKFANWLAENENKLLGHPQLQIRPSTPAAMAMADPLPTKVHGSTAHSSTPKASSTEGNSSPYPTGLHINHKLPGHLNGPDGFSQKAGISGTHNLDEFMQAAAQNKVKIVSQTPGAIRGISNIEYQIPSLNSAGGVAVDAAGMPIIKNQLFTKTVYDPAIYSNATMLELGQQAAASGYQSALASGVRAYNSSAGGIPFRVYLDPQTGLVTNFHPR